MDFAIAIGKFFNCTLVGVLLIIDFEVAFTIVDENANRANGDLFALLHPNDLTIVVDGLHAVTGYTQTEIGTGWHGGLREADHFKAALVQECAGTGRDSKIADRHFNELYDIACFDLRLVSARGDQVSLVGGDLFQSFLVQLRLGARVEWGQDATKNDYETGKAKVLDELMNAVIDKLPK